MYLAIVYYVFVLSVGMFDWIESFWDAIKDFFKSTYNKIAEYVIDLFIWLYEYVFYIINTFLDWMLNLLADLLVAAIESISPYLPSGLIETIMDSFAYLQYINGWVPVKLAIQLTIAYYAIALVLGVFRFVLSLIPGVG